MVFRNLLENLSTQELTLVILLYTVQGFVLGALSADEVKARIRQVMSFLSRLTRNGQE